MVQAVTPKPFQKILDASNQRQPVGKTEYVTEGHPEAKLLHHYLDQADIEKGLPLSKRVGKFQERHNAQLPAGGVPLKVDEKAGPKTLAALRESVAATKWKDSCPADTTDRAFLGLDQPTPKPSAPPPTGAVPAASVLSNPTDDSRRAQLEKALPVGERVRAMDGRVKDLQNRIAAYQPPMEDEAPAVLHTRNKLLAEAQGQQKKLQASEPYRAVDAYRSAAEQLKQAQGHRAMFDSDGDRAQRLADLEQKAKHVAELKAKAQPHLAPIEAREKALQDDVDALQRPYFVASRDHFKGKVAELQAELAALQSDPDYRDFTSKTKELSELSHHRNFSPIPRTDQELLNSQLRIEELQKQLERYKVSGR